MKVFLYTDVHWSETSSIINSQGEKYSTRLENLIKSVSWAEEQAVLNHCDQIVCLGDFFDRPDLTSAELTALNEVKWADLPHFFIVGNHESPHKSLTYNSVNALKNLGFEIITQPVVKEYEDGVLTFIPYCLEEDRRPLKEYLIDTRKNNIVLSHNDIKGLQYGMFTSKEGFDIEEIDRDCNSFINGHLHNGTKFSKRGRNLGNLTGQNFTEDAFTYNHCAYILDTFYLSVTPVENPHAFNFYKLEIVLDDDVEVFEKLKNNAVLSIKCTQKQLPKVKEIIKNSDKIAASRIILIPETHDENGEEVIISLGSADYLQSFASFVTDIYGVDEVIQEELVEVLK